MNPRVLIVDDDPEHLEILMRFFSNWHWDVIGVRDTSEPLAVSPHLTLVVMDRALPGTSGADVLRQLRRDGVTSPAVVLTGMPVDVIEHEFDGLGVTHVVSKGDSYGFLNQYARSLVADRPPGPRGRP